MIPKRLTPWTHSMMSKTLIALMPNRVSACILHAKTVLETGRSGGYEGSCCWNYNVGNIRALPGQPYVILGDAYEIDSNGRRYVPDREQNRFRAYDCFDDGVRGLVDLLSKTERYQPVWSMLVNNPTPENYVILAKQCGYFTAPIEDICDDNGRVTAYGYRKPLVSLYNQFWRRTYGVEA